MAVRNPDNVLVGGYRVFIVEDDNYYELGWMSGEAKVEEQASSLTIKESEGGTVTTIATNKEVHFTFNMLEHNTDTILKLNPSAVPIGGNDDPDADGVGFAVGTFQSDKTFRIETWHKKRSGKYICTRIFKGKNSGNFTSLLLNQDNANPVPIDVVGLADETKDTDRNIYEQFECDASKAPGGGW